MSRLARFVERIARGQINVLVLGETGAGKEVLAERIHRLSPRRESPLLRLNCAALSESLLESELFGHERGAFTGAAGTKPGLLETAHGGTVFLDEVGELPLAIQAKLLRVIETRSVLRVGGLEPRAIDVRFIAATNRELEAEVARGAFRADLRFRLDGACVVVPPLRERVGEIAGLARQFAAEAAARLDAASPPIADDAMRWLERYAWPGNVRELRNVVERAVLLADDGAIALEHLPIDRRVAPASPCAARTEAIDTLDDLRRRVAELERERILCALAQCGGNQTRAAKVLGMPRRTLVSRLAKYDVPRPRR
jgi:two-component system, NtrC family, response regulator AtoC